MPYLESEVFENYVKIAEQEGLISEADYADARVGSDNKDVIEMLYGVKPNGKDYKHIMEQAHPETVVIAPAHDKMNSILENNIERQNIMAMIALKTPSGDHTAHRYVKASEDLTKSLIRVGFLLDNKDQKDLMKLADSCSGRLSQLEKKANPLLLIPWYAYTAAVSLGLLAVFNRTSDSKQHIVNNCENTLKELNDLQGQMPEIDPMIEDVTQLMGLARQFEPAKKIRALPDVLTIHTDFAPQIAIANQFKQKLDYMVRRIPEYINILKTSQPLKSEPSYDWWEKAKDVYHMIVADNPEDVINAFEGLQKSIADALQQVNQVLSSAQRFAPQIQNEIKERSREPGVLANLQQSFGEGTA